MPLPDKITVPIIGKPIPFFAGRILGRGQAEQGNLRFRDLGVKRQRQRLGLAGQRIISDFIARPRIALRPRNTSPKQA